MCNTPNSLLLNQHNGDDAPQDRKWSTFEYFNPSGKSSILFSADNWNECWLWRNKLSFVTHFKTLLQDLTGRTEENPEIFQSGNSNFRAENQSQDIPQI